MTRVALILAGILAAAPAAAHEEFRVVGEIASAQPGKIAVKMRNGATASIGLDPATTVTRDKAKVDLKELKPGQFVVVDAYGDDYDDLLALTIQLVPPIASSK